MLDLPELEDKGLIKAIQATDGIIQNNHPIFVFICLGSIISVLGTIKTSILSLGVVEAWLIIFASVFYLLGVQGITISIHLPLDKHIHKFDINSTNSQILSSMLEDFETKWNYLNNIQTGIALFVILFFLLIITLC